MLFFHIWTLQATLSDYKVKCEFSNIDFAADKVLQYKSIRSAKGGKYQDRKECFGPAMVREDQEDLTKEKRDSIQKDTKLITKDYQHTLEKIKEICQWFSKEVISETRSGSGKIIYKHFEKIKQIRGGSPNIEPMPNGIGSNFVNFNVSAGDRTFLP